MELRVLFVEDSVDDVEHMLGRLREAGIEPQWRRVETEAAARAALAAEGWELALVGDDLTRFGGLEPLHVLTEVAPAVPAIAVSGAMTEDAAMAAITAGAVDFVLKRDLARLTPAVRRALQSAQLRREAEHLRRTVDGAVLAMSHLVDTRDPYTAGHERRVAELATAIAADMGGAADEITGLRLAGLIHDIGKIAVPVEILAKPGCLSEVEFGLIRQHPESGFEILEAIDFGQPVADMVRQHHERLDGSGYPRALSGEDILPEACILAVADVVEAMSLPRPYRAALGMEAACAEINAQAGVKYDAAVVASCARLVGKQGFQFAS